ncbi:MAG: gliding motility-associated ABC transporter permease subunit GldF [Cytophagaceae bacterium]
MWSVFKKETSVLLNSMVAYMAIVVFLTFIGLFLWVIPDTSLFESGFADLDTMFYLGPLAFMLLIPAITMRSFAEEKKDGTIELLLTKPISDWDIILGKFFSSGAIVLVALIPTVIYYVSVYMLGKPVGNIDSAAVFTSYIGLLFMGLVFVSIGIFSSVVSNNQVVSFILSLLLSYVWYKGLNDFASIDLWQGSAVFLKSLSLDYHYLALSKGVVDARNVFYFLTIITVMLGLTKLKLGSRNW